MQEPSGIKRTDLSVPGRQVIQTVAIFPIRLVVVTWVAIRSR
jgi:hypothetical protein